MVKLSAESIRYGLLRDLNIKIREIEAKSGVSHATISIELQGRGANKKLYRQKIYKYYASRASLGISYEEFWKDKL